MAVLGNGEHAIFIATESGRKNELAISVDDKRRPIGPVLIEIGCLAQPKFGPAAVSADPGSRHPIKKEMNRDFAGGLLRSGPSASIRFDSEPSEESCRARIANG